MAVEIEVRERPILFSVPMVRAILEGRKTMTRRVVKPQPCWQLDGFKGWAHWVKKALYRSGLPTIDLCPYGQPGDRLWVKEAWRPKISHHCALNTCDCGDVLVSYLADGAEYFFKDGDIPLDWLMPKAAKKGTVTPLFMPRWASRITLEVTSVRVERLQDISEEDAKSEGTQEPSLRELSSELKQAAWSERQVFQRLWDSINAKKHPWDSNPWVWVVEFKNI